MECSRWGRRGRESHSAVIGLGLLFLLVTAACNPVDQPAISGLSENGIESVDVPMRPSARDILAKMRQTYAAAQAYRDEAFLTLRYQLQGRYLEEPHPWAVEFQRENKLRCSVYNARIRADGQRMGCFIYDFSSGNLDNQWKIQTADQVLPLKGLFEDEICRHYVTGQMDMPLDPARPDIAVMFFPPTPGLLTGRLDVGWLDGETAARSADRVVDARPCYGIQVRHGDLTIELMVDRDSWLLREIRYPIQALDRKLQGNPAVQNLEIVATFRAATTSPDFPPDHFALELPDNAVPVRQFVAVPEPFPSASIGKPVPAMGLLDDKGNGIDQTGWQGKVTLLAWRGDTLADDAWHNVIQQVAENLSGREYHIAEIQPIPDLQPGDPQLRDLLQRIPYSPNMATCADPGFASGQTIGLNSWPVYAIVDRQGVLQFVNTIDDELPDAEEICSVMIRVRSADDVAGEMRREYEKFLDEYFDRLQSARLDTGN